MNTRCLSLILLLLCCAVPIASATGMAKIYLSPAEASWKTGQTVQVKVMYDNNLNPLARDISLYLDWNAEMLKYESCEFKVGHTTTAGLLSSHELNMLLGDFTNGYPNGDYALAVLTFKVIGPGDTPIVIKVARLNGMDGKPATFVTGKGSYSITGDAVANPGTVATTRPTTLPLPGQQVVTIVTPAATYTKIPTVPVGTAQRTVQTVQTLNGAAPGWPALTVGATIPTPFPTTVETTIPTTEPTAVVRTTFPTTFPTTVPTTAWTTYPTPTAEPIVVATTETPASSVGNLGFSYGIALNDTPTVNETPTVNGTPTPYLTLPSPLGNSSNLSNLTEEPTVPWPVGTTPTAYPTFTFRTTVTPKAVNNTSAAVASAGSIVGDAWLVALAAAAGIALVAVGVVVMRRDRDDWL